jgi:type IV pilus assembly protein PilB
MTLPKTNQLNEQLKKMHDQAEERDAQRRAQSAGLPYMELGKAPVQTDALKLVPRDKAKMAQLAPFQYKHPNLAIAIVDPDDHNAKEIIKDLEQHNYNLKVFVGSLRGIQHIWEGYKYVYEDTKEITSRVDIDSKKLQELVDKIKGIESVAELVHEFDIANSPINEFFEIYLSGALATKTSDIHFEPAKDSVHLRFRIDGLLHNIVTDIEPRFYKSVVGRVKLLSNLKLNVTDRPQDGRYTIGFGEKEIEIRVAIAPSEFGEVIVMRVLNPDAISLTLEQLGIRKDDLEIVSGALNLPNGMILNTGPTGSGKTTTLYAFLKSKNNPETKIITVEDPIEYHLDGIEQTQIDDEAGYTFASGLRSLMRQDPDVILVGEVRDKETAEIALQAALTGHLVFSTVHANEAAGAIPRFVDIGVKVSSIGSALELIIAQRLVRRLCEKCKVPQELTDELKKNIESFMGKLPERVSRDDYTNPTIFRSKEGGCEVCNGFGFKGRVGIYEFFRVGSEMEELILQETGEVALRARAVADGMVVMQQDGVLKVFKGLTTFSEIEEVTEPIKF